MSHYTRVVQKERLLVYKTARIWFLFPIHIFYFLTETVYRSLCQPTTSSNRMFNHISMLFVLYYHKCYKIHYNHFLNNYYSFAGIYFDIMYISIDIFMNDVYFMAVSCMLLVIGP